MCVSEFYEDSIDNHITDGKYSRCEARAADRYSMYCVLYFVHHQCIQPCKALLSDIEWTGLSSQEEYPCEELVSSNHSPDFSSME